MRPLPLLSVTAAAALLAATTGTAAAAATEPETGLGAAQSTGSLIQLEAADTLLEALRLSLPTSTSASGASALVSVHPLVKDGQDVVDPVTVTAGDDDADFASESAGVEGLLGLTSPQGRVSALIGEEGPVAELTSDLGSIELVGLPLVGDGGLDALSAVNGTTALSSKSLALDEFALPTLLDLLGALGIDVDALPAGTLLDLLDLVQLPEGVDLAVLDALLEGLADGATVEDLAGSLEGLESLLEQIEGLEDALQPVEGLRAQSLHGSLGPIGDVLTPEGAAVLDGLLDNVDLENAQAVQDLLDQLVDVLEDVLGDLPLDALEGLPLAEDLLGLLDVSLLSIGALEVSTLASSGATDAATVTGTVEDLKVLDHDLLSTLLPSGDLTRLLADDGPLGQVEGVVNGLLGEVSAVLGEVPGLAVPLPELELLTVVEELTEQGGVERARAGVDVLRLSWALDDLVVPDALALLPVGGMSAASVSAQALPAELAPVEMTVGSLSDASAFSASGAPPTTDDGTPVTTVANPAPVRQLPRTGGPALAALAGLALLGSAALLRRRGEAGAAEL